MINTGVQTKMTGQADDIAFGGPVSLRYIERLLREGAEVIRQLQGQIADLQRELLTATETLNGRGT